MTARDWVAVASGLTLVITLPWTIAAGEAVPGFVVGALWLALLGAALTWVLAGLAGDDNRLTTKVGSLVLAFGLVAMTVFFFIALAAILALVGALILGLDLVANSRTARGRTVGGLLVVGPVGVATVLAGVGVGSEAAFTAMTWCVALSLGFATAATPLLVDSTPTRP